ncbi:hypothetical protein Tco_1215443 [Tanacetum coccineum]
MPTHKRKYIAPCYTKKVFGNMKRVGKDFSGNVTSLFPTMVVQNQPQPSTITQTPTTSTQTPTIIQPTPSQPQKKQLRMPRRKVTEVPQPSEPSHVADEAINEEMDDSLVRAATTASSLEVEQDSGNIDKTQSKATPNELSSQGTSLGGGPRCQEIIGGTSAQTRFKRVYKISNDSLLARGNTLQSDEDSIKLNELMELCTNLQSRVLDLEKTKTSQQIRIESLERKGRISVIDANVDITLNEEVAEEVVEAINIAKLIVDAAKVSTAGIQVSTADAVKTVSAAAQSTTAATTIEEITLAQALQKMKSTTPKSKGAKINADYQLAQRLQAKEQEELTDAEKARLFAQLLETRRKHFAEKRAEEK